MSEAPCLTPDPNGPLVFVRFCPTWDYIDGVRELCRSVCVATFANLLLAERVQVVIQELLENAVKYSTGGDVELELDLHLPEIVITVLNSASEEAFEALQTELASLQAMAPEQGYVFALRRASAARAGMNKLGLARLRHEGQVELTAAVEGASRVRVTARGRL